MLQRSPRGRLLQALRAVGAFRLTRWITRRDLRIVCYHGFAIHDEHEFRPGLFISADAFERRLAYLRRGGYNVLPLDEALERQRAGTLPPDSVCITIDDGFHSVARIAAPLMRRYGMPSTVYLTTYYVDCQAPIFNLATAYMFWRTTRTTVDLEGLGIEGLPSPSLAWSELTEAQRTEVVAAIIRHAVTRLERSGRCELLGHISERTGVPLAEIVDRRMFHIMTRDEARELLEQGVDLQLHTHRHCSPETEDAALRELEDNAVVLRQITGREPTHFCYPSGRYHMWRPAWLARRGVASATTCEPGFVRGSPAPYELGRFLDGANVDQLCFEAEMAGALEIVRRVRAAGRRFGESVRERVALGARPLPQPTAQPTARQ